MLRLLIGDAFSVNPNNHFIMHEDYVSYPELVYVKSQKKAQNIAIPRPPIFPLFNPVIILTYFNSATLSKKPIGSSFIIFILNSFLFTYSTTFGKRSKE